MSRRGVDRRGDVTTFGEYSLMNTGWIRVSNDEAITENMTTFGAFRAVE